MTSRVRTAGHWFTFPAGLGSVASPALPDEQKPGGSARLSSQLQPSARGQRDRFLRGGNDQPDRTGPEGFLDRPKEIRFAAGLDEVQPLRNSVRQGAGHWPIMIMGSSHPDDRPSKPHRLKQREALPAPALGLMDTPVQQIKRIVITLAVSVMEDLHGCPP